MILNSAQWFIDNNASIHVERVWISCAVLYALFIFIYSISIVSHLVSPGDPLQPYEGPILPVVLWRIPEEKLWVFVNWYISLFPTDRYLRMYIHAYVHTYIQIYIHTHILHTCIHIYTLSLGVGGSFYCFRFERSFWQIRSGLL